MRLKIVFNPDGAGIPLHYRQGVQAFLYSIFPLEIAEYMHDMGNIDGSKQFKPFVFSNIIGKYTVIDKKIYFSDGAILYFATPISELLASVYLFLQNNPVMVLYDQFMPVVSVQILDESMDDGTYHYGTLSPVTVYSTEDGFTSYAEPYHNEYRDMLKENLKRKYEQIYQEPCHEYINIYSFSDVKQNICKFKNTHVVAYRYRCKITTTKNMHDIILNCGLGSKNAAGFGMMELVNSKTKSVK